MWNNPRKRPKGKFSVVSPLAIVLNGLISFWLHWVNPVKWNAGRVQGCRYSIESLSAGNQ